MLQLALNDLLFTEPLITGTANRFPRGEAVAAAGGD